MRVASDLRQSPWKLDDLRKDAWSVGSSALREEESPSGHSVCAMGWDELEKSASPSKLVALSRLSSSYECTGDASVFVPAGARDVDPDGTR